MIFYTLFGPTSKLEIHDDKIKLMRNPFLGFFNRKDRLVEFKLCELTHFRIIEPKFVWGKVECVSEDGKKADFRFTTNAVMMGKIEKYIHTLIAKNEIRKQEALVEITVEPIVAAPIEAVVANILPFKPKPKHKKNKLKKRRAA